MKLRDLAQQRKTLRVMLDDPARRHEQDLRPLTQRWEAFGWFAQEINGHDLPEVIAAFQKAAQTKGRPSVIVARTVKGYPIQHLLTKDPNHHGKPLTKEEQDKALAFLDSQP